MSRCHIFVTGSPGVGKSTLIQRVLSELQRQNPDLVALGFYTEEVRQGGERLGFDVVALDGRRGPLARAGGGPRGAPSVGKYAVDLPSFERLALPELAPQPGVQLYCVDEVGKMELLSPAFLPAVTSLLDAAPVVLGTLPVARLPQVEALKRRPGVRVVSISREDRDRKMREVLAALQAALRCKP